MLGNWRLVHGIRWVDWVLCFVWCLFRKAASFRRDDGGKLDIRAINGFGLVYGFGLMLWDSTS